MYSNSGEIIEIAGILVKDSEIAAEFHKMINIEGKIPSEVSKLTGITKSMLKERGFPLVKVIREFKQFIGDYTLISHNLSFYISFLREAMERAGVPDITNQGIDTLSLARKTVRGLKSYKLEELMKHFNIPYKKLHRSEEDAMATLELYHKLIEIRNFKNKN